MSTALILAGHGSHLTPQTAGLVWQHVDALRAMGIADEVTAAFWKEMPSFHQVISTLAADNITIIPLFTAQGYFTQTVIPAEMGLEGPITRQHGRTLRYTRTLSEHPYLSEIVTQRVNDALGTSAFPPDRTAVAVIGHSTRRNPESRRATEAQAAQLRAKSMTAEVVAVYLDDAPGIPEVYGLTTAPNLIAVPYFLAFGSHTTRDVPQELGLEPGQSAGQINGRSVFYTAPVGVEASLQEVLIELAREVGTALHPIRAGSTWQCFPTVGGEALIEAVNEFGEMPFGELQLTPKRVQVIGDHGALTRISDPATLRTWIRAAQGFRPLATSTDLPGGWEIVVERPSMLPAIVETVYPGVIADWANYRHNILSVETLEMTAARQTGMYRQLAVLNNDLRARCMAETCGKCVRQPTWFYGQSPADALPCGEACNLWMSRALEMAE